MVTLGLVKSEQRIRAQVNVQLDHSITIICLLPYYIIVYFIYYIININLLI